MLPPLISNDRFHMKTIIPSFMPNTSRNYPISEELFDYRAIAAKINKPNRTRISSLQFPLQGSFLSPHNPFPPQPMFTEVLTPQPPQGISELRRVNNIQNVHRPVFQNKMPYFQPNSVINTPRIDQTRLRLSTDQDDIRDHIILSPRQSGIENMYLDTERRKIDSIVNSVHRRSNSNVLLTMPTNQFNSPPHHQPTMILNPNVRYLSETDRLTMKLKKNPSEQKFVRAETLKSYPQEEKLTAVMPKQQKQDEEEIDEEESETLPVKNISNKMNGKHHKTKSLDIRKKAILNFSRKNKESHDRLD